MDFLFGTENFERLFSSGISFSDFILRLLINLIVIYVIARQIYFRLVKNRDYLFVMFIFNIVVFFVCYLLSNTTLSLGFAFGIFAIFSILRYRTRVVPTKEMTYMFVAISIAVINALSFDEIGFPIIIITNVIIVAFIFILEKTWVKNEIRKRILYEKIDLIKPENRNLLIKDLQDRTGLIINRVEIDRIDFLRDVARISVYYYEE